MVEYWHLRCEKKSCMGESDFLRFCWGRENDHNTQVGQLKGGAHFLCCVCLGSLSITIHLICIETGFNNFHEETHRLKFTKHVSNVLHP